MSSSNWTHHKQREAHAVGPARKGGLFWLGHASPLTTPLEPQPVGWKRWVCWSLNPRMHIST